MKNLNSFLFFLKEFMLFFGLVFIISTTLVLFFKKEKESYEILNNSTSSEPDNEESEEENFTVTETYKQMWKIIWLVPVKKLIIILMTVKVNTFISRNNQLYI